MTLRSKLDHHFGVLLQAMYKREAKDSADVGGYYLDSIKPDRVRLYRIEQITTVTGGTSCPFGETRYKASELIEVIQFATVAIEESKK